MPLTFVSSELWKLGSMAQGSLTVCQQVSVNRSSYLLEIAIHLHITVNGTIVNIGLYW